jgi:hypothetical protein
MFASPLLYRKDRQFARDFYSLRHGACVAGKWEKGRTSPFGEVLFALFPAQLEGSALGALAFGGGAVAAAHLDGVQRAAVLSAGVVGAGVHRALDAGVAGLTGLVVHNDKPSLFGWA